MNTVNESVLFRTSAASDVQCSNGVLTVAGLTGTKKSRISSISQLKYHAEVVQVVTIGATAYTPTGSTQYTIELGDVTRRRNGAQEQLKRYTYVTPASITDLGATAALQREAISLALVAIINADTSNFVTAASLGTGTGITITDAAGYYPVFNQTQRIRNGASTVRPCQNPDDSGFLATNVSITTAAVYSFGVGADLAASIPVVDALYGGLLSGYLLGEMNGLGPKTAAGLPAVSGQNYDGFIILSLTDTQAHNQRGQLALIPKMQAIFVDNGTGSATTNLTGFTAFEREILRHLFNNYQNDPSALADFFDNANVNSSTTTGAAPAGTDNIAVAMWTGKNMWYYNPIGTATILAPIVGATGLPLVLDSTDEEGMELSAPILTQSPKEFIVGKSEASFYARITLGAHIASIEEFAFGFRKKAAYAADVAAYVTASVDLAILGWIDADTTKGLFQMETSLAGATLTKTSTVFTGLDSTTYDLLITVDINGVGNFYINSVNYTSLLATPFIFTAGLHLIPFVNAINGASANSIPLMVQTAFVPSITWRV